MIKELGFSTYLKETYVHVYNICERKLEFEQTWTIYDSYSRMKFPFDILFGFLEYFQAVWLKLKFVNSNAS